MIFKYYVFILSIIFYGCSNGLTLFRDCENLLGTPILNCLNCFYHPRSGCWNQLACARYSITQDYWEKAGAPTINRTFGELEAFRKCKDNENCVLNTVKIYTELFGEIDCNGDGKFDCKDRFSIHIFGSNCRNSSYGIAVSRRFNICSRDIGVIPMNEVDYEPE